jgi:hypothetical protein
MPKYQAGDRFYQQIENNDDFSGLYYRIVGRSNVVLNTWVDDPTYDKSRDSEFLYKYIDERYPDNEMSIKEEGINKMISSGMWREKSRIALHDTNQLDDID